MFLQFHIMIDDKINEIWINSYYILAFAPFDGGGDLKAFIMLVDGTVYNVTEEVYDILQKVGK